MGSLFNPHMLPRCFDTPRLTRLQDVITRYETHVIKHSEYVAAHEAERELAQNALQREHNALGSVNHLQKILNRDPFVLVLVDGDGMIFNTQSLRDGEAGGKQAAAVLHDAVREWATAGVVDCPPDVKVRTSP